MRRSVRRRREGTGSLLPKTLKARAQVIFKHPYIELLWHQHGHPPLISGALCIYAEARQRESLVLVEKSASAGFTGSGCPLGAWKRPQLALLERRNECRMPPSVLVVPSETGSVTACQSAVCLSGGSSSVKQLAAALHSNSAQEGPVA